MFLTIDSATYHPVCLGTGSSRNRVGNHVSLRANDDHIKKVADQDLIPVYRRCIALKKPPHGTFALFR
jgi:hypothetical protein